MIKVKIEPRNGDGLYEIHVGDAGDNFLVSHQGYENVEDAERIVRRLFVFDNRVLDPSLPAPEHVDLSVRYRNGKGKHEMLR